AGATKSNRVVSVQTDMLSANLDNMFAPLLASDWSNQLHAQIPLQQLMLESEKYFMKFVSPSERKNKAFSSLCSPTANLWVKLQNEGDGKGLLFPSPSGEGGGGYGASRHCLRRCCSGQQPN